MINLKYFIKGIVCSKKFDSPAIALGASFIAIGALLKNLGFNIQESIFSTVLGFYAADFLSKDMIIGLAIVNPIYFMCAMIGVMKTIQLSSAIILGAFLGPIFYFFSPEWSVLLGGLVAGSIAYFIGEVYDS